MTEDASASQSRSGAEALPAASCEHRMGPCQVFAQRFELHTSDSGVAGLLSALYAAMLEDTGGKGHLDVGVAEGTSSLAGGAEPPASDSAVYRLLALSAGAAGVVARDDEVLVVSHRPATLLGRLVWATNQQVSNGTTDRLLLHAGAVDRDGCGALIPAEMESGKAALVTGLLDRGFGYLTDEAASVSADLLDGGLREAAVDRPGLVGGARPPRPRVGC